MQFDTTYIEADHIPIRSFEVDVLLTSNHYLILFMHSTNTLLTHISEATILKGLNAAESAFRTLSIPIEQNT